MDIRDAFFGKLYELAHQDKNVIVLAADMGVNEFKRFRELKGQFYNVGISEQNMVSMAAGLALEGKKVFIYSIIPFLVYRAFEQIKLDICSMKLPVTIIGGCAGLSNSTDGGTHHGIHDIAIMRNLDITIFNPSTANLASKMVEYCYENKSPIYIRLDKGIFPEYYENADFIGMDVLRWADTMIIATGNMVHNAMGTNCGVIDVYQLKPLDSGLLKELISDAKQIITLEEHLNTGLGSIISEFLTDNHINIPLRRIGVTSEKVIGTREYLHKHFRIDVESLKHDIRC